MGCVYIAICKINDKKYIGKTVGSLQKRKIRHERESSNGSNLYFHNALRYYGFDNFEWGILFSSGNDSILCKIEIDFIKEENTKEPNGYNMTEGGEKGCGRPFGYHHTEETKEKMRKPKTPEHCANLSKSLSKNPPMLGKKHSKESIAKMRKSASNREGRNSIRI